MPALTWDAVGERFYETGTDHGVLYPRSDTGLYDTGVAWNGLISVTESPSGAEPSPQYADNIKYLNLVSAEEFGGTIEAFTFPDEFGECDGTIDVGGVAVGQQGRRIFGLSYRTLLGNDVAGTNLGYKLHLVYGALAAPSEKAYTTVNDSPEALTFSWEFSTTAVEVPGGLKPTATLTIPSTKFEPADMKALEDVLYGATATPARLPLPAEVFTLLGVTPSEPVVGE